MKEGVFKMVGMSKPMSITLENDKQELFWPKVDIDQDEFDGLMHYLDGHWDGTQRARVTYERLSEDGTPISSVFCGFFEEIN